MKRGWPRPLTFVGETHSNPNSKTGRYAFKWRNRNYPHPYAAEEDDVASASMSRQVECVRFKRCLNCGLVVDDEMVGLIVAKYNEKTGTYSGKHLYLHAESGPYHLKCLVQTFALCPHIVVSGRYQAAYGAWSDVKNELRAILGLLTADA